MQGSHFNQAFSGFKAKAGHALKASVHGICKRLAISKALVADYMSKEHVIHYDKLTNLPNRLYFTQTLQSELNAAKANNVNPALILIDLLEFKSINDVYGLDVGDRVLIHVSARLEKLAPANAIVSRLSSDEFLLYLPEEFCELDLLEFVSQTFEDLCRPYQIDNWQIRISLTCGVALAKEANYTTSELLANVDIAQQYAKQHSTQHFCLFLPAMKADKLRIQQVAESIQDGLDNNEFSLHYQAKVNKHAEIVGYEALTRWNNHILGELSPTEFIPIAEQSGKIRHISTWVIKQAFSDIPALLEHSGEHIKVAINLSTIDLKAQTLLSTLELAMLEHGVNGKNIEFEITETSFLENIERVNIVFDKLRALGCSVALDDFGTGYSSLSYLTKIHLNVLKLDKQFVDELIASKHGKVITESIVNMAHQLSMRVCAEGIETEEQALQLIEIGCEELQGFYYSKPAPLSAILNG